jgi:hypothetical protein
MQITITDHNDWEGEDFSFILTVDEETAKHIKSLSDDRMSVDLNTDHTTVSVVQINKNSDNGYMSRMNFCEWDQPEDLTKIKDFYQEVVYKGIGFKIIQ